jgi:hypothetical protein
MPTPPSKAVAFPTVETAPSQPDPPPAVADAALASPAQPVQTLQPQPLQPALQPPTLASTPSTTETPSGRAEGGSDAPGPAGDCGIFDQVQSQLRSSPKVLDALRRIPRTAKSVANAIQLWDGDWIVPRTPDGPAIMVPIEQTIVQAVAASPPKCAAAQVQGPRFILVQDGPETTIVGLGSGVWLWSSLVATSKAKLSRP